MPAAALAEVVVSLGGTILDVRHVGRAAGRASPWSPWLARYTLGEGPDAHLPVAIVGTFAVMAVFTVIAGRLHRDRSAVKRDVDQLAQVGLVTIETKPLPGHGHMKEIRAAAGIFRPDASIRGLEHLLGDIQTDHLLAVHGADDLSCAHSCITIHGGSSVVE